MLVLLDAATHTLTVRPPAGYHFNLEAPPPQLTSGAKVTKITAAEAQVAVPDGVTAVTARWFVCDDGKGMCLAVREELVIEGGAVKSRQPAPEAKGDVPSGAPATAGSVSHGFLVDRPDEALAQAKKERRPLMIDFFGIWCPPCNALDETVFCRPEFQRATEAFVKLKLDADRETSWALKEKYKVGGYPTVVFATADGEEIDRVVGSRTLKEFIARAEDALAHQTGERSVKQRALRHLERAEFAEAEKLLVGTTETRLQKRAHVGVAREAVKQAGLDQKQAARETYIATLKVALQNETGPDALEWAAALADLAGEDNDAAGAKAAREKIIAVAQALEKQPALIEAEGLSRADLLQYRAGALDAMFDKDAAAKLYAEAAAEYEREVKEAGLTPATARGYNLERAFCLGKAGQSEAALALYTQLEASYPNEFTFLFAHAGLLHTLRRMEEAEPLARKALGLAYGDNRLRAAERLAKIQRERGKADDARAIVDEALASAKAPADPFNRTHRYIKALKSLRKAL